MSQCIAKANLLRCVGCFAFPFVALAAYGYKVSSVGDNFQSFLSKIGTGGTPLVSAVLVVGGCLAWVLVTWPKALTAWRYAGCAISFDDLKLNIYDDQLERHDIAAVQVVRRPLDFQLCVERKDGSTIARSIVLLSPSPEVIVKRLRSAAL
jgi:hypothetical protein